MHLSTVLLAAMVASQASAPRFKSGTLPDLPAATVGGGEVLLEATVSPEGKVSAVRTLRDTPPYTDALRGAVSGWTFEPALSESGAPVEGRVLVAASYRPPTLMGPAPGEPPRDVAAASPGVPFPSRTAPAAYPPAAQGDWQVLAEVEVGPDGSVRAVRARRPAPGFTESALAAASQWRFQPASGAGGPRRAYIVFGFRQPVVIGPRRP